MIGKSFPSQKKVDPLLIKLAQSISSAILRDGAHNPSSKLALFLGAGSSSSSEIITVSEMLQHFKSEIYEREQQVFSDEKEGTTWLKQQDWYDNKESEYSNLFEKCYETEGERQRYIENIIFGKKPSFGYLVLANLISSGYFKTILTTNFDDLVYIACTSFTETRPVIYALGGFATEMQLTTNRPRILKIHGDFLYSKLKNIGAEFNTHDKNMEDQFKQVVKEYDGMVVLGYSGNDKSVMKMFKKIPPGKIIYWCYRKGSTVSNTVKRFMTGKGKYLVEIDGFDEFMDFIRSYLGITNKMLAKNYRLNLDIAKNLFYKFEDHSTVEFVEEIAHSYHISSLYIHAYNAFKGGKYDEAVNLYQQILDRDNKDPKVYYNLGIIYSREKSTLKKAEEFYRKSVKQKPDFADPYHNLGLLIAKDEKRFSESVKWYRKALSVNPEHPGTRNSLAIYYAKRSKFNEALLEIKQSVKYAPQIISYHLTLAAIYKKLNMKKELIETLTEAKKLILPNQAYLRACIEGLLENIPESVKLLRLAFKEQEVRKLDAKCDIEFDWIRHDPRFKAIIK